MSVSEEIIIRNVDLNDAKELLRIYAYYVKTTAISFEYDVPTIEEFTERIKKISLKYPYIVAEMKNATIFGDEVIGYAYANTFIDRAAYDHCVELTIYLNHKFQGQGIGKKLYQYLQNELKAMKILNLYACVAYPLVEDEFLTMNSVNFHKHLGFEICGHFKKCGYKFDRWYDMVYMEKIINSELRM
ncbi:MAG: N-acetyltransferase [Selenomonadaceae bacterium]|nr:N-acetyltransferase [Selenomonadaceae bacterium]